MAIPDINQILKDANAPAWVSEDTLKKIAASKRVENKTLQSIFNEMTGSDINFDDMVESAEAAEESFKKTNELIISGTASTTKLFGLAARDSDPLGATTELMQMGANAVKGALNSVTQYTQFLGPWGLGISKTIDVSAAVAVGAVGVAAIYAKMVAAQEKSTRTMIDYGGVVSNLSHYTKMRASLTNVGMSMDEMSKMMTGNKGMLANLPGGLMNTTLDFIDFAGKIESDTSKTMGDFGYGVEKMTERLLQETKLRYMSGKLTQFGDIEKEKIRSNFEKSSALSTMLAGKFGDTRDALLSLREEALTNVSFVSAMNRNATFIAETYGVNAEENIKSAEGIMHMATSKLFGSDFAAQSAIVSNNMLSDIQFDQSAATNMPAEMTKMLASMGNGVLQQYMHIIEQKNTGQLDESALLLELQKLTEMVASATPKHGKEEHILAGNQMIAHATQAPEAFMDMTTDSIAMGLNAVKLMAEHADGSIDAIDASRKAFLKMVDALTPDYENGAAVIKRFEGGLGMVVSMFEEVGFIKKQKPKPDANPDAKPDAKPDATPKGMMTDQDAAAAKALITQAEEKDKYKNAKAKAKAIIRAQNAHGKSSGMGSMAKWFSDLLSGKTETTGSGSILGGKPLKIRFTDDFDTVAAPILKITTGTAATIMAGQKRFKEHNDLVTDYLIERNNAAKMLWRNFEPGQFNKRTLRYPDGRPEPRKDEDGRWYEDITTYTREQMYDRDNDYKYEIKRAYVDQLNVAGIKSMYELDRNIINYLKDITNEVDKTALAENIND